MEVADQLTATVCRRAVFEDLAFEHSITMVFFRRRQHGHASQETAEAGTEGPTFPPCRFPFDAASGV